MVDKSREALGSERPNAQRIQAEINFLAEHSDSIFWTDAFTDAMLEEGLNDADIILVLTEGKVVGGVEEGLGRGDWQVRMSGRVTGRGGLIIVTAILGSKRKVVPLGLRLRGAR